LQVGEGAFSRTRCFGVFSKLGLDRILAKRKKILSLTLSEIACAPAVREGAISRTRCFGVFFKLGLDRILAKIKSSLSLTVSEIAVRPGGTISCLYLQPPFLKKNARLFSSAFVARGVSVARGVNSPRQLLPRPFGPWQKLASGSWPTESAR